MQLTVRVYMQPDAEFQIDAEPSDTIGEFKAKIGAARGYDSEKLNIIFCGHGLANDKTLESCRISENGFIVMSISRTETDLPVPEQLDAMEYTALTEEEVSEYLGTGSLLAALRPRTTAAFVPPNESTITPKGETATESDPLTTPASTFKYRPLSPTAFDAELTSEFVPFTFDYKPMSSSVPVSEGTSLDTPPARNVSTLNYKPISPAFDERSATASTFKYNPMSLPERAFDPSSAFQSATNTSTSKYEPMSPSATPSEGASSSVPQTSNVSAFKYQSLSSTSPLTEGLYHPPTTNVSTFKYRPLSSPSVRESISGSVPGSTSTSSSHSTFKHIPMSSSGPTYVSTSTHVAGPVPSTGRPSNLSQGGTTRIPGAAQGGSDNPPGELTSADMAQFRELLVENPDLRQQFIQKISQEDPELGQSLAQNPDLLLQFLDGMARHGSAGSSIGGARRDSGSGAQPVRLSVTPAERAAIDRLEGLGFPRQAVIEAYFACDKNEELAANYLVENA